MYNIVTVDSGEKIKLKQYYIYMKKVLIFLPLDSNLQKLYRKFAALSNFVRHFKNSHLKFINQLSFPLYSVYISKYKFQNIIYFQNYIYKIYRIYQIKL